MLSDDDDYDDEDDDDEDDEEEDNGGDDDEDEETDDDDEDEDFFKAGGDRSIAIRQKAWPPLITAETFPCRVGGENQQPLPRKPATPRPRPRKLTQLP